LINVYYWEHRTVYKVNFVVRTTLIRQLHSTRWFCIVKWHWCCLLGLSPNIWWKCAVLCKAV